MISYHLFVSLVKLLLFPGFTDAGSPRMQAGIVQLYRINILTVTAVPILTLTGDREFGRFGSDVTVCQIFYFIMYYLHLLPIYIAQRMKTRFDMSDLHFIFLSPGCRLSLFNGIFFVISNPLQFL